MSLPSFFKIDATRIEEHVARELNRHAVLAHHDREAELGERIELLLEQLEALADLLELLFVFLELIESRRLIGEVGIEVGDVDARLFELFFELRDESRRRRQIGFGFLVGCLLAIELRLQILVLFQLRLPLLFGMAATGEGKERRR